MEHARKMVILPESTVARIQQQQQQQQGPPSLEEKPAVAPSPAPPAAAAAADGEGSAQTPGDNLSRLDSEMYEILKSDKFADEREKCHHYLQTLRRYLFFTRQADEGDTSDGARKSDAPPTAPSIEDIVADVPKLIAQRVRLLLEYWRKHCPGRFKWDDTGSVIIDGKLVPGSNAAELLTYAVKKSKRSETIDDVPEGRGELARFLVDSRTPKRFIGNFKLVTLANFIDNFESNVSGASTPSPARTGPLTRLGAKRKWMRMAN